MCVVCVGKESMVKNEKKIKNEKKKKKKKRTVDFFLFLPGIIEVLKPFEDNGHCESYLGELFKEVVILKDCFPQSKIAIVPL